MWAIEGRIPDHVQRAIVSHLKENCRFTFEGSAQLRADPLPFYPDTLLCQLLVEPGARVGSGRRRRQQQIEAPQRFYFLFKMVAGDAILIPLTGERGDILLANRWLGLRLKNDEQRLDYARFYYAFARTESPPGFHNVPRQMSELGFADIVTEKQIWGVYGAMWRFLDQDRPLHLRVRFEPRGVPWRSRHRAHLPLQIGSDIFDVDLKIWAADGHISYRKTELVYRDLALAAEPQERPGRIRLPRYVWWGERMFTLYRNIKVHINQALYLASTSLFFLASALALLSAMSPWGQSSLALVAVLTGIGTWTTWLKAACLYCIAYFVLTTLLILDAEKVRNGLLMWSRRFEGSWLDQLLHGLVLKRRRTESGYRPGLIKRIGWAGTMLLFWTGYLVLVFTSLQIGYRPYLAADDKALLDVMQVFAEQALLYIPVVFYYVGSKSLDRAKLALVSGEIMIVFQLIMGLLVIRRVHRFWASTASSRLSS